LGTTPNPQKPNKWAIAKQYSDGMNLYEYVSSNPVNFIDPYGLWHYALSPSQRKSEPRTLVLPDSGESLYSEAAKQKLADFMVLNYREFSKWAMLDKQKCGYKVPNTGFIDVGSYAIFSLGIYQRSYKNGIKNAWEEQGLHVIETIPVIDTAIKQHLRGSRNEIYAYFYTGHGAISCLAGDKGGKYWAVPPEKYTSYGIAEMQLIACDTHDGADTWNKNVSKAGHLRTVEGGLNFKDAFGWPSYVDENGE